MGNSFPQSPDHSLKEIALEIVGIWNARFFNRMRKLLRRPLARERRYFDTSNAAFRSRRRYRISSYPGKVTLFRYSEQPSPALYTTDPLMGWNAVGESLEIVDVPGTHTDLTEDNAREVCGRLREHLHAAQDAVAANAAAS